MKKIEVVAAIIHQGDSVFIAQRGYGEFEGLWEFPGGKIEDNESHEEALIREIKEELCLNINIEQHCCTIDYDYPSFHLTMHCYFCSALDNSPTLLEHKATNWVKISELDDVNWVPADKLILKYILDRFNK